jgi:dTDP-4-amino-4,6-dideoxygalactose transaminase
MHLQRPYADYPCAPGGLPTSEAAAERVLALPMHPYLDAKVQERIIDAVQRFAR